MRNTLFLVISACFWGVNFFFLERMQLEAGFIETGFWRYLFAVAVLGVAVLGNMPSKHMLRGRLPGIFLVGTVCLFLFNILMFAGVRLGSSVNASLIMSLNPIATMIMASLNSRERLRPTQIAGAAICLVGVVFLLMRGTLANLLALEFSLGDLLIFGAMLLTALYHILSRKIARGMGSVQYTFLTNAVCLAGFVVALPFAGPLDFGEHSLGFWIAAIAFGALGTALTYVLWNKGLSGVPAQRAGLFMNLVPLATAITAVILGRDLEAYFLVSIVLILGGLSLSTLHKTANSGPAAVEDPQG